MKLSTKRLLVTSLVPEQMCSGLPVSEASTHFCWTMIRGGCFDKVAGLVHTTIPQRLALEGDYGAVTFIQTRFFWHRSAGRLLNNMIDSLKVVKEAKGFDSVWYYNLEWVQVLSYLIMKVMGKKLYVIVADFTPPVRRFSFASFVQRLFLRSRGLITLSSRTTFRHPNQISIAGIISNETLERRCTTPVPVRHKFLFSGGLEAIHGIDLAIAAFKEIPEASLVITGKCLKQDISDAPNICFAGYLSQEDYDRLFREISCCVCFRDPSFPENLNNFPSKIIEYLSYKKQVISTIRYPELQGLKYVYAHYDLESVKDAIRQVMMSEPEGYDQTGTLSGLFSVDRWTKALSEIEDRSH